ncbi:hypothetical protein CR513_58053, partial [Mucuna pruriens]
MKWSLAHDDEGCRYGHMTINLSECVNEVLKGARNLPITSLVKCMYDRLIEYFVQRRAEPRSKFGGVVKAFNLIIKRGGQTWIIVLNTQKCECGAFQVFRYTCSHAITASTHFFFVVFYSTKNIIDAYSRQWFSIDNDANILTSSGPQVVLNQSIIRGKGHPKLNTHKK